MLQSFHSFISSVPVIMFQSIIMTSFVSSSSSRSMTSPHGDEISSTSSSHKSTTWDAVHVSDDLRQ